MGHTDQGREIYVFAVSQPIMHENRRHKVRGESTGTDYWTDESISSMWCNENYQQSTRVTSMKTPSNG